MRRAFSLVKILCVVAILAVLAALLFPVFAWSKERAKLTDCGARLRQFAVALNLYRADHDDRGYVWGSRDDGKNGYRYPYNNFEGMKSYLADGSPLWCPEPNAAPEGIAWNLHAYRVFGNRRRAESPGINLHVPPRPLPGTVVAYCANHTKLQYDPRYLAGAELRMGTYPFVREDTSMGVSRSEGLSMGDSSDPQAKHPYNILRFPGEPWPPIPEE